MSGNKKETSVSPFGETFSLPDESEYNNEHKRLATLVTKSKSEGKEIVVVMGLGFVGVVMAAIVADTKDQEGNNSKFVIGCQRPSSRSFWKIPHINKGLSPVKADDPEVYDIIKRTVVEKQTFTATYNSDCLEFADCVVIDVQCDFKKNHLGDMKTGETDMKALEATLKTIGEKISPHCLVLIETTIACSRFHL